MRDRIRAGDREAFAELYEEHARAVYNHAFRLTGDWSAAEEVMSETFLDAWRTRGKVEPEGDSLRPWLLGIATNKARNANRGLRRRLAFLARRPTTDQVLDFADESASRIDGVRELDAMRRALTALRRPEREVLALCVWSGLDYAQAAAALGVPVGTVRSRLSRARARLRRLTDEQLGTDSGRPRPGSRTAEGSGPGSRTAEGSEGSTAALTALAVQEEAR
ncbi:RNA polymerase sigma factor [Streptomyces sp. UNOC14_S4]|uniref:RNA polymerase sigma factor n=1 Tax=Streptomyces sp. UNOC14_S4 TaxID=2872340 RepID=UPI001E49C7B9|nr:RNA polymerase sigma factor [Streptomyces sp. UNOC14_S4]MCC3768003.1 RNA polymerase sigma factor [Streptomyces sp. UNOC14_S4]